MKIKHNTTYSTQYLHMRKHKVKRGDFVKQGDVIGWGRDDWKHFWATRLL